MSANGDCGKEEGGLVVSKDLFDLFCSGERFRLDTERKRGRPRKDEGFKDCKVVLDRMKEAYYRKKYSKTYGRKTAAGDVSASVGGSETVHAPDQKAVGDGKDDRAKKRSSNKMVKPTFLPSQLRAAQKDQNPPVPPAKPAMKTGPLPAAAAAGPSSSAPKPSQPKNLIVITGKTGKLITLQPKTPPVLLDRNKYISSIQPDRKAGSTQTENLPCFEKAVQTEYTFDPLDTNAASESYELPNVKELVEFILATPKYSGNLDDASKNEFLDMSRNVTAKTGKKMPVNNIHFHRELKMQLFLDLRDCMSYDCSGNMVIHNAVLENNMKLMMRQIFVLRLRNVTVNVPNSQGITPIQMAIMNNSEMKIIQKLVDNGADAYVIDGKGNSLVHLAVIYGTSQTLHLILSCFKSAEIINCTNEEGLTPLMITTIDKKKEMAEVLLKFGANPNIRDEKSGKTALFHAVESNCDYIINLLLSYKADPKINNYLGMCAIDAAKDLGTVVLTDGYEDDWSPKAKKKRVEKGSKFTFVTSLRKISSTKFPPSRKN